MRSAYKLATNFNTWLSLFGERRSAEGEVTG